MFPALFAGLLATVITFPRPLLLLLTLWMLVRIISLAQPRILLATLLVASMIAGVAAFNHQWAVRQRLTQAAEVRQTLLVMPAEVHVNGNLVTMTAVDQRSRARENVMVRVRQPAELQRIEAVDRPALWQVAGTLQPLLPATNDQQFDRRFYYQQHHIYNELRVKEVQDLRPQPVRGWRAGCHVLRYRLIAYFKTMPQPLGGYCQQLLVGDHGSDNPDLTQSVKRLGIIHLFCISGMHIILLTNLTRLLGGYLWLEREQLDWILIIGLPLYLIIGGGSASLIRAVIMAEVTLGHRLLKMDALDGWAISLIAGLLWNPYLLFTLGGQLSYLLSLLLQVMAEREGELKRCWLLGLLSLPAILNRTFEFHLLSLVASYVMSPLFSIVIFPLVIISAASYWLLPLPGELVNTFLCIFQRILHWLAALPGEINFGKPPESFALLLFLATLWLVQRPRPARYVVLFSLYACCFLQIHFPPFGEVVFTDIGQGDSIIIRTPFNRQVLLIDTGGKVQFEQPRWAQVTSHEDFAQKTSINYLKSCGLSRIDAVYLSHHDADHIGYLPSVLEAMTVKQIVVPAGMENQPALQKRLAAQQYQGQLLGVTDRAQPPNQQLRVVHPFAPGAAKNEDSLVLAGRFGGQDFLFTGDLDRAGELAVVARYPGLRATVLKLGHHGSKTASDPRFLRHLGVKTAIISAGRFNRYHHPSDEVVAALKQARISPLSTQQYGMIKYHYYGSHGYWQTTVKGDELRWTLPNSLNN